MLADVLAPFPPPSRRTLPVHARAKHSYCRKVSLCEIFMYRVSLRNCTVLYFCLLNTTKLLLPVYNMRGVSRIPRRA